MREREKKARTIAIKLGFTTRVYALRERVFYIVSESQLPHNRGVSSDTTDRKLGCGIYFIFLYIYLLQPTGIYYIF